MGYTSDTSTSLKESNAEHDKTDTEVVLNSSKSCCKSCKRTQYVIVLQGLFNVALIVLIIVLFIIVSKLKVNIDESLMHSRTKRLHPDQSLTRQYSVGNKIVNDTDENKPTITTSTTTPEVTVKLKPKPFLKSLQILDTEVLPKLVRLCQTNKTDMFVTFFCQVST